MMMPPLTLKFLYLFIFLISTVNTLPIDRSHPSTGWQDIAQYPLLSEATTETIAKGLANKEFTSVDLVHAYLKRIAEVNSTLHVVTEINPDALSIAMALDKERSTGVIRGVLHGIPILVKNTMATKDRMSTNAGSYALIGSRVPRDSTVVQKLRSAGAIILGKTNLSQWSNQRSSNSSSGWSAIGGQAYSPFYPDQNPSGSSSGSAVSSALGLVLGSLGVETDGSIISPSSANNIVGMKPTVGLTSRALVIPTSEHQDTVGPMTRTVKDAAYILQAIAGVDPYDNYTSAIPDNGNLPDYVAACNFSALSGARIGIPTNAIALRADRTFGSRLAAFAKAVKVMQDAGAIIVKDTNFTAAEAYLNSTSETQVLNADFMVDLERYLSLLVENPENITNLEDLRTFTQQKPEEDWPNRNTELWDDALDKQRWNNTDPRFWTAYQKDLYFGGEGGLLGAIARHNLDAIVMPAERSPTWAAIVGAPMITVPMGSTPPNTTVEVSSRGMVMQAPNIPFGISFMGAKWTEKKLIGLAYAFEQRTNARSRIHPYIAPKTELRDVIQSQKSKDIGRTSLIFRE